MHVKQRYRCLLCITTILLSVFVNIATVHAESGDTIVYVTDTGSKYHSAGCSYLKSKNEISLYVAIRAKYTPCSRCHPGGMSEEELQYYDSLLGIKTSSTTSDILTNPNTAPSSTKSLPNTTGNITNDTPKDSDEWFFTLLCILVGGGTVGVIAKGTNEDIQHRKQDIQKVENNKREKEAYRIRQQYLMRLKSQNEYNYYFKLYAFYSPLDFVALPKGAYIRDGIPVTSDKGTYGLYTVYITKSGTKYHQNKNCVNAKVQKVHIKDIHGYLPCAKCVKQAIPPLKWYYEYKRIVNIKKTYNIP